jgi:hypothetical protein
VRYRVKTDFARVVACNCSMCGRAGSMLTFVPPSDFELISGEEALSDYQFAKRRIHHLFCRTCGIKSFARGKAPDGNEMVAVNLRCLDNVDLEKVPTKAFDGKAL